MTEPDAWRALLEGVSVVVNAAGALQQGPRDDLESVQQRAMLALYAAARFPAQARIVQVSAAGAAADSPLAFFATKGRADAALQGSGLPHVILKPALVISPTAYGGTALLRGLAGLPFATPIVAGESAVQTVWIEDVAEAAVAAAEGRLGDAAVFELAERPVRSLREVVGLLRAWLGFRPAPSPEAPRFLGPLVGAAADLAGTFGWRSPLRSTALKVMAEGVHGDPDDGPAALGRELKTLPQMLAAMPAGPQERWFARLWLLRPVMVVTLAAFWLASGVIGLIRLDAAEAVLTGRGVATDFARAAVVLGAAADVALGAALLVRRLARAALLGMLALAFAYITGAALLAPDLWFDPLGAMAKTVPVLLSCLVLLAILEDR